MRALILALGLAFCASPALANDVQVEVGHNRIDPSEIHVAAGSAVVFRNADAMPGGHTVAADDGSFESPPLAKDQTYRRPFEKAGRIGIHLVQHPSARATVVVE